MGTRRSEKSPEVKLQQLELSLSICKDTLKAIAANGDLHSSWNARKALNNVESQLRRSNVNV